MRYADDEHERFLLTHTEAAQLLGIGVSTLYALEKVPSFPVPVWLGPRMKRHVREDLLRWAKQHRAKPAGEACG